MSIELWLAFVVASVALLILPGPTTLTIVSYSAAQGRRANLPLVAAATLGDSTALSVSLMGLGALLSASAFWFSVVKWIGGLYLLFLGIRMLREGVVSSKVSAREVSGSRLRLFVDTYLVTALNPKGILFFMAFLPQFVDPAAPMAGQMALLAVTFVALAALNASAYAAFASAASRLLASRRARQGFHLVGGSVLSAAGVWTLLAKRPS